MFYLCRGRAGRGWSAPIAGQYGFSVAYRVALLPSRKGIRCRSFDPVNRPNTRDVVVGLLIEGVRPLRPKGMEAARVSFVSASSAFQDDEEEDIDLPRPLRSSGEREWRKERGRKATRALGNVQKKKKLEKIMKQLFGGLSKEKKKREFHIGFKNWTIDRQCFGSTIVLQRSKNSLQKLIWFIFEQQSQW